MANPEPVRRDPDRRRGNDEARPVTVRIGSRGPVPGAMAGLILAFLVLAIIKPWGGPPASPHLVQEPTPRPSIHAGPAGPIAGSAGPIAEPARPGPSSSAWFHCGEQPDWRVYTLEIFADHVVRAWRGVEPAKAASGPLDPAIPLIQVGPNIDAVGYCGPWTSAERAPDGSVVAAWRIGQTVSAVPGFEPVLLVSVIADVPTALGGLYRPAIDRLDSRVLGTGRWTFGQYVLSIQAPGWERWWAVEIPRPGAAAPPKGP
jgi:hypothetical protein